MARYRLIISTHGATGIHIYTNTRALLDGIGDNTAQNKAVNAAYWKLSKLRGADRLKNGETHTVGIVDTFNGYDIQLDLMQ